MRLLWNLSIVVVLGLVVHEVAHHFFLEHPSELAEPVAYVKRFALEYWRTLSILGQDLAAKWR